MAYSKIALNILGLLFVFMIFDACAQWSPGGTMVYMGDLNLAGSSGASGSTPYALGSIPIGLPVNNSSMNSSFINNSTIDTASSALMPLDLSRYAGDRASKNLTGYKNIMYPIAESRGSTASTAGAGGCGC